MDAALVRDDFYEVDVTESVRNVLGWIQGDRSDVPILMDDGEPLGILNERGMLSSRIDGREKVGAYLVGTRCLREDGDLTQAVNLVLTSGLAYLPVVDRDGALVGYVAGEDLAVEVVHRARGDASRNLGPRALGEPVEDPLVTRTSLGEAINRLQGTTLPVLPVVDGDNRHLEGVLERSAAIEAEVLTEHEAGGRGDRNDKGRNESRSNFPVEGLMTTHYATLQGDADPGAIVRALADFGYGVVADDGDPWGVVTPLTVLRALRGGPGNTGGPGARRASLRRG